ncbi:MAG: hypothetical protein LLG14_21870 [Nocardiaceae bacterium]|nr:hypothetical protein [Nocardiaceae bacterium]
MTAATTELEWVNLFDDVATSVTRHSCARILAAYMSDFLTRPLAELGRTGAVCPFVRTSLKKKTVWVTFLDGDDRTLTDETIHAAIDDAATLFTELRRQSPDEATHTMIVAMPGLTEFQRIDDIHFLRKSEFVARGQMLGQFYPGCTQEGLWNREFRPLDAPVPMLIIRRMMSTDYPFLASDTKWLYAYFSRFAPELPVRLRSSLADTMVVTGEVAGAFAALRMHNEDEHAR